MAVFSDTSAWFSLAFAASSDPRAWFRGSDQMPLTDPDGTRVEFMEFLPVKEACCSPYTGSQTSPGPAW